MLKKRIVPVVLIREGIAVQSFGFSRYLPIGRPEIAVDFLNQWGADEIAIIDMDATKRGSIDFEMIALLSKQCLVPMSYGGGIQTPEAMVRAIQAGADKVMINAAYRENPALVAEGARLLGEQCMIVCLDAKKDSSGTHRVYDYTKKSIVPGSDVVDEVARAQKNGAGEIFLNSVDEDGSKRGYDLALVKAAAAKMRVPLTICGGANHPDHFAEAMLIKNVSAVAAANFFQYQEHSVTILKSLLKRRSDLAIRLDSHCTYEESGFMPSGRIARKDDHRLKELLYEFHEKEVI